MSYGGQHPLTWQDVEEIIVNAVRAIQRMPDREQRWLLTGFRSGHPQVMPDFGDRRAALETAEGETELDVKQRQNDAMKGRFTVSGFRFSTPPEHIDQIDTMFDYVALVPDKDRHFFNAVIFSKTVGARSANWQTIREICSWTDKNPRTGNFTIQTKTLQKRYERLMAKLLQDIKKEQIA